MSEATRIMGINGQPMENPAIKLQQEKDQAAFKEHNSYFDEIALALKPIMELLQKRQFNGASDFAYELAEDKRKLANLLTYLLVSNLEMATAIQKMGFNADQNAAGFSKSVKALTTFVEQHEHRISKLDGGALRN